MKKSGRTKVLDLAFLVSVAFSPFAIMNQIISIDILLEIAFHVNPGPDILNLSLTVSQTSSNVNVNVDLLTNNLNSVETDPRPHLSNPLSRHRTPR